MERKYYLHKAIPSGKGSRKGRPDSSVNQGFVCAQCGAPVPPPEAGTKQRNHCPLCLHSLHVDLAVGDRRSLCRGIMVPISLWVRDDSDVLLLHRCSRCGVIKTNRIAGDDNGPALKSLARRLRDVV